MQKILLTVKIFSIFAYIFQKINCSINGKNTLFLFTIEPQEYNNNNCNHNHNTIKPYTSEKLKIKIKKVNLLNTKPNCKSSNIKPNKNPSTFPYKKRIKSSNLTLDRLNTLVKTGMLKLKKDKKHLNRKYINCSFCHTFITCRWTKHKIYSIWMCETCYRKDIKNPLELTADQTEMINRNDTNLYDKVTEKRMRCHICGKTNAYRFAKSKSQLWYCNACHQNPGRKFIGADELNKTHILMHVFRKCRAQKMYEQKMKTGFVNLNNIVCVACSNCEALHKCYERVNPTDKKQLCPACWSYFKRNGEHRPRSMEIKRRRKVEFDDVDINDPLDLSTK